jgi:hydroxyethylthiazole kinase-like uncharacterized protein yjeF
VRASGRLTEASLRRWPLPDPSGAEGKEARGRLLVVGGSTRIPGAVRLAAEAGLRAGAGKLQVATARRVAIGTALAIPEALVMPLDEDAAGEPSRVSRQVREAAREADAVVLGPGLLDSAVTARLCASLARVARGCVVFDAGALAAGVRATGPSRILTPHPGEMAELLGIDVDRVQAEPRPLAVNLSRDCGAVVVLKGATTWIAAPDGRHWVNTAGTAGLGTSGSGDVLSGVIAGLAARGAGPAQAAAWGVYLHARAGARLARRHGTLGFLAREIAAEVPPLMR